MPIWESVNCGRVESRRASLKKWLIKGSGQVDTLIMSLKQWTLGGILRSPSRAEGWWWIFFPRKQTVRWRFGADVLGRLSGSAFGGREGSGLGRGNVELWYNWGMWEALELEWLVLQSCSKLRKRTSSPNPSMGQSLDRLLPGNGCNLVQGPPLPTPTPNQTALYHHPNKHS